MKTCLELDLNFSHDRSFESVLLLRKAARLVVADHTFLSTDLFPSAQDAAGAWLNIAGSRYKTIAGSIRAQIVEPPSAMSDSNKFKIFPIARFEGRSVEVSRPKVNNISQYHTNSSSSSQDSTADMPLARKSHVSHMTRTINITRTIGHCVTTIRLNLGQISALVSSSFDRSMTPRMNISTACSRRSSSMKRRVAAESRPRS